MTRNNHNQERDQDYRPFFDEMGCGAMLAEIADRDKVGNITTIRILKVNSAFERLTALTRTEVAGNNFRLFLAQSEEALLKAVTQTVRSGRPVVVEKFLPDTGKWALISFFRVGDNRIGATFIDISARKQNEERQLQARRDLEIVVRERTSDLNQAVLDLQKESDFRTLTQQKVQEQSQELEARVADLAEANSALKMLLKERDSRRRELEERLISNLNELVRPQLAKLTEGNLSRRQRALLYSIDMNLDEITSPLTRKFILEASRLTPAETQVAQLIRQGKTTKEIVSLLGVAASTVNFHRLNIRRRLGLTNKRINLQSYLKSLTE